MDVKMMGYSDELLIESQSSAFMFVFMLHFFSDLCVFQHWEVFKVITEVFILVPALVGLKGNLEMTLAARLSTAVRRLLHVSFCMTT